VGELGWELHPAMADLPALYGAVWAAGEGHGIADFGLYAMNSLRMEKGYRGWGAELTNEVTMLEADMARFCASAKDDFVGKAATEDNAAGPLRLVYFEVEAEDADVRGGEPIFLGDACVGVTTSGGYGYAVEKSLGFGYVPPEQAEPGSIIDIGLLDARCPATVLAEPIYDPANERLAS
jgi:dimethylglycine dehydrogenase